MFERKICKDKKRPTLVDPILKLLGFEINGLNRRRLMIFLFTIAFVLTLNKLDKIVFLKNNIKKNN
jgi:hypothetical protein